MDICVGGCYFHFPLQSVVDALVIHINNGMKSEVDRALDVLLALLEHHCRSMLNYVALIKVCMTHPTAGASLQVHAQLCCADQGMHDPSHCWSITAGPCSTMLH